MSTWRLLRGLFKNRPLVHLSNILLWTGIHVAPVLPCLITRAFFDTLTGTRPAGIGLWSIIALLVAATLGRCALILTGFVTSLSSRGLVSGLLWHTALPAAH